MTTKQEYQESLNRMEEAYYSSDNSMDAMIRFKEDINLITELVNENFKENVETNLEHYKDRIIELCIDELAISKGKVVKCCAITCSECGFSTGHGCNEKLKEWLRKPYEKPTYKLTQFEFDLLNAHKDSGMQKRLSNYRPLLELNEKGYFKDIDTSVPIHKILDNCKVVR